METTGTAIEVAGLVGLIPSEGTSSVLLPIGGYLNMGGTLLNAGLDYNEGNKLKAASRIGIFFGTWGLGKGIKNISKAASLEKTSEKILDAHTIIYGELANKTMDEAFKN
ncbi:hypothetical protein [Elizabethkingia meningoseptica]